MFLGGVIAFLSFLDSLNQPIPRPPEGSDIQKSEPTAGNRVSRNNDTAAEPSLLSVDHREAASQHGPQAQKADEGDSQASAAWWGWFNATAVTTFTFFLMILGGLQWWAMHCQSRHMREGLAISQQTIDEMRAERRPWIAVHEAIFQDFETGKSPIVDLAVRNCGKTPARITAVRCCIVWSPDPGNPNAILPTPGELTKWVDECLENTAESANTEIVPPLDMDKLIRHLFEGQILADWQVDRVKNGSACCVLAIAFRYSGPGCNAGYTREDFMFDTGRQCWGIRKRSSAQMT